MPIHTDVRNRLLAQAAQQWGLLSRAQALDAGVTRSQWQRDAGGLVEPVLGSIKRVGTPADPTRIQDERRRVRAALMLGGPDAAACWGSALRLFGIAGTPVGDTEHVALAGARGHQRAAISRHWFELTPDERTHHLGLPTVSVVRTLAQVGRIYDDVHLLSVLDSALHGGLLSAPAMALLAEHLPASSRPMLALADGLRESPLESRAAHMMTLAGLPFTPQVSMTLPEIGVVRVDFLVGPGTVVECDGRDAHDEITARYADRKRHEALERAGYVVVRVTWHDATREQAGTCGRIRLAMEDAAARERGWRPPLLGSVRRP